MVCHSLYTHALHALHYMQAASQSLGVEAVASFRQIVLYKNGARREATGASAMCNWREVRCAAYLAYCNTWLTVLFNIAGGYFLSQHNCGSHDHYPFQKSIQGLHRALRQSETKGLE